MFQIDESMIDWSRAQFALTAMYHWLFVPLTLGLGLIMSLAETKYYRSGDDFWKATAMFWQKIFGINFAIGVATGLILEFQFGTNWSNYSIFVGDIFGAPLAIEGILAFFMEATFVAVMFFGWGRVSKKFHLTSTWLTWLGATFSAWWILVANAWMQYPVGMEFNPDTLRNEMVDFAAVAFSPVAVTKFLHTNLSSWMLGAVVVVGISSWYLLRHRHNRFAIQSIKLASIVGVIASLLTIATGHHSAGQVAQHQPMKLAAMEALYDGGNGMDLSAVGLLNPAKASYADSEKPYLFNIGLPKMLSLMSFNDPNAYVPGIRNIIEGGYTMPSGEVALSADEKITRGKIAITALSEYRKAKAAKDETTAAESLAVLRENFPYFGYGYIKDKADLVPNVTINYYSFRIMVGLGMLFLALFIWGWWRTRGSRSSIKSDRWYLYLALISIPLVYVASQAGWVVAEVGRQPWTIQDILPVGAAVSDLAASSVQITFFVFALLFTALLIAEISIMVKAVKHGPMLDEKDQIIEK